MWHDAKSLGRKRMEKLPSGCCFWCEYWLEWNANDRYHRADKFPLEVGDHIGLYFKLLLSRFPLYLDAHHWSSNEDCYFLSRNQQKQIFHQDNCLYFVHLLGSSPRLTHWLAACKKFLVRKLYYEKRDAQGGLVLIPKIINDFRLDGFHLSLPEIHHIAVETTLDFAMAVFHSEE